MSELTNLTDAQLQTLRTLRTSCQDILKSIVDSLNGRVDVQEVMVQLVASENIAQTLIDFPDDDLARLTLQVSVAALVNTQSVMAINGRHVPAFYRRSAEIIRFPVCAFTRPGQPIRGKRGEVISS